ILLNLETLVHHLKALLTLVRINRREPNPTNEPLRKDWMDTLRDTRKLRDCACRGNRPLLHRNRDSQVVSVRLSCKVNGVRHRPNDLVNLIIIRSVGIPNSHLREHRRKPEVPDSDSPVTSQLLSLLRVVHIPVGGTDEEPSNQVMRHATPDPIQLPPIINERSQVHVTEVTIFPCFKRDLTARVGGDDLVRFSDVRFGRVPNSGLTVAKHPFSNLCQNPKSLLMPRICSPETGPRLIDVIPERIIDLHTNICSPVLTCVALAPKELLNLRIIPMHDCHSSASAIASAHYALRDGVINLHCPDAGQHVSDMLVHHGRHLVQHQREGQRSGSPTTEGLQPCAFGADPAHVEHTAFILRMTVVSAQQIGKGCCPPLTAVLYLEGTRPIRAVIIAENTRVLHLLIVRMLRITNDVNRIRRLDQRVLIEESVRVVRADSPALHKTEESELEMLRDVLSPTTDVTVEEVLPSGDTGSPQVPSGRKDLELLHQRYKLITLVTLVLTGKGKVPVNHSTHGLRPRFPGAVRLRPGVRALVDQLACWPPWDFSVH